MTYEFYDLLLSDGFCSTTAALYLDMVDQHDVMSGRHDTMQPLLPGGVPCQTGYTSHLIHLIRNLPI